MKKLFAYIILFISTISYLEAKLNIDNELEKFANEKILNTLSRDLTLETYIRNKKDNKIDTRYHAIYQQNLVKIVSLIQRLLLVRCELLGTPNSNDPIIAKFQKPDKQEAPVIITEEDITYYCNYIDNLALSGDLSIPKTNLVIPAKYNNLQSKDIYNYYKEYQIAEETPSVLKALEASAKFALRNIMIRMFYATNKDILMVLTSLFPSKFSYFGPLFIALNLAYTYPTIEEIKLDEIHLNETNYQSMDLELIEFNAFKLRYINKLQLDAMIKVALANNINSLKLSLGSSEEAIKYIQEKKTELKDNLNLDILLYAIDQSTINSWDLGIAHNDIGKRVLELYLQEAAAPPHNNKEKKKAAKDESNDKEKCLIS